MSSLWQRGQTRLRAGQGVARRWSEGGQEVGEDLADLLATP